MRLLDQTLLPSREAFIETSDYREVAEAIKKLCVRGAPAIGVAGAYGAALGALSIGADDPKEFLSQFASVIRLLWSTRPTAVNLAWALHKIEQAARNGRTVAGIKEEVIAEAKRIQQHEEQATAMLSKNGAGLLRDGATVLTHCNAGSLATCGCGTALGVIKEAVAQGKKIQVFATETRPLLQGARLTSWELVRAGIPVTLITDSMAGHFLAKRQIEAVVVGADRIAANGDVANKIGTYSIAVLSMENAVPFFVAAPTSTVDMSAGSGLDIPIEERNHDEVTHVAGLRVAAAGVNVANPAFDVTPAKYVTAIITEKGVVLPPYSNGLKQLSDSNSSAEVGR